MKIERTKNAARNIVWGLIEKVTLLLLPFICRTVMIKILGADYIGLNSLFTSILSVLSISELGFGTAIIFSMYKPIAEEDNDTICALLNTYKKIYQLIGTIILIAGVVVIPFLPKLIKGDIPADINLYVLYSLHLFDTVIGYFLFAYKAAIFSAYQRNDLTSKRSAIINLIGNILKIIGLFVFKSYYAYIIILPFVTIATNLANAYLAKKMFPQIICKGKITDEMKKGIKKRIVGLISFKVYNVIFTSVDTIVISSFLGLTPLAIYNNYYYIQTAIVGFLTIFTTSITAGIGNKMVTNSIDDNYRDYKNFTFANGWICSWCAVCLLCLYQPFMKLWVGEELTFPLFTMILMVLYFLLPRITTMQYTYREAAGLWWEDRFRPLIATAVNLTSNIILVKLIGMNGVIISTLICTIFINVPWGAIILFKNYFHKSAKEYFCHLLYYIFITIIVGGISFFICSLIKSDEILFFLIKAAICCIIPNILFFILYRNRKEYEYTKKIFLGIIKKFRKV